MAVTKPASFPRYDELDSKANLKALNTLSLVLEITYTLEYMKRENNLILSRNVSLCRLHLNQYNFAQCKCYAPISYTQTPIGIGFKCPFLSYLASAFRQYVLTPSQHPDITH
jgi:hypothetical protein